MIILYLKAIENNSKMYGHNKCEPMKMEFAMQELIYLNTNIQRMYHKYGNTFPQTYPAINILNHFITKTYVLLHIDFL